MPKPPLNLHSFQALIELVQHLRGPEGCPWDLEQSHQTLAPYCLEETYELIEAIETQDDESLKDELGDVLFQVALHAQLAAERKAFNIEQVLQNLNEKMVRRHPHVFSDQKVSGSEEVWKNWEKIKKLEKKKVGSSFGLPQNLPALQASYKIGVKTQKAGFDWSKPAEVLEKVAEELEELKAEINNQNQEKMAEELGDLMFSLAQFSRHVGLEPEQVLRAANRKFENRYFKMLNLASEKGLEFEKLSLDEKESLWKQIKKD
jgi:tetrapyrrole methylase family protein/MazG family protein